MLRLIALASCLLVMSSAALASNKIVPLFKCTSQDKDLVIQTRKHIGSVSNLYQMSVKSKKDSNLEIVTLTSFIESFNRTEFATNFIDDGKLSIVIVRYFNPFKGCLDYVGEFFYKDPMNGQTTKAKDLVCRNLQAPQKSCR